MKFFERYLSLWVIICIALGIVVGEWGGSYVEALSHWEFRGLNLPVVALVWLMIYPMMVQIDFNSLRQVRSRWQGLALTVFINWLVKPFSMAFFAWLFFDKLYAAWLHPDEASQYVAGAILLGAAPCTAMVFVWSYLSQGDPTYTLVQVSVNDIIILFAFVPLVRVLIGIADVSIPYDVLAASVALFVALPLAAGYLSNRWLIQKRGEAWFRERFLPHLRPFSIFALLATLVLIFSFQGHTLLSRPYTILLIALPLTLQTYFIFFVTWFLGQKLRLAHAICAPAAMIGASNFFELAVAVAISLFGLDSGATLATVVGVLIEVPVMLSLVRLANRWRY